MSNISYSPLKNKKLRLINSICAIGNPIIDISAELSENNINQYNMTETVINFMNEENKNFFDLIQNQPYVSITMGGSALNTLRAISWCLATEGEQRNNNIKISIVGAVGNDTYKDKIINTLKQQNINYLFEQNNLNTSKCAIGTNNGKKYILSQISASENLSDYYVEQNWNEIFSHDAIIIEGYFLKEKYELCYNICEKFYRAGKYIILTMRDPLFNNQYRDKIIEIAKMADMIVTNYRSIHSLCRRNITNLNPSPVLRDIHALLTNNKERLILITVGKNGVFCGLLDSEGEKYFQKLPDKLNNDDIRDFNGAGDAFLGGFLYQLYKGGTLEDCCVAGNKIASIVIRNYGCIFPRISN